MALSLNKLEVIANQAQSLHMRLEPLEASHAEPVYIGTPVRVGDMHAGVAASHRRVEPTMEEMAAAQQVTAGSPAARAVSLGMNPMD